MTPREPDRFDAQARELVAQHYGPALSRESVPWIAAALRAEHASALERAAQRVELECPCHGPRPQSWCKWCRLGVDIRALIPPATAPAAETGTVWDPARNEKSWRPDAAPAADYDPITAPIPAGDMNGPHGPLPAAETGKAEGEIPVGNCGECGAPLGTRDDKMPDAPPERLNPALCWIQWRGGSHARARTAPPEGGSR